MNKDRRTRVEKIIGQMADIRNALEELKDEECEAFDNMPEGLQQSERGEQSEAAADALEEAYDLAEQLETRLGEIE